MPIQLNKDRYLPDENIVITNADVVGRNVGIYKLTPSSNPTNGSFVNTWTINSLPSDALTEIGPSDLSGFGVGSFAACEVAFDGPPDYDQVDYATLKTISDFKGETKFVIQPKIITPMGQPRTYHQFSKRVRLTYDKPAQEEEMQLTGEPSQMIFSTNDFPPECKINEFVYSTNGGDNAGWCGTNTEIKFKFRVKEKATGNYVSLLSDGELAIRNPDQNYTEDHWFPSDNSAFDPGNDVSFYWFDAIALYPTTTHDWELWADFLTTGTPTAYPIGLPAYAGQGTSINLVMYGEDLSS